MIKIEKTEVFGWEAAICSARNSYQSWEKSDSIFHGSIYNHLVFTFGKIDLELLSKLSKAGPDHAKFMRMIHVQADVTAPLYWWKHADQYRIGVTTNSTSTMHSIHKKEFTLDDFSHDHLTKDGVDVIEEIIDALNDARDIYLHWDEIPKDKLVRDLSTQKDIWWQMIQLLPSSYNQLRTIDLNYAVLKNIYHARKDHRLDEWHGFCKWIEEELPYSKELIMS